MYMDHCLFARHCIGSQRYPTSSMHPQSDGGMNKCLVVFPVYFAVIDITAKSYVSLKEGSSTSFPREGLYFRCGFEQRARVFQITESLAFLISLFIPLSAANSSLIPASWPLGLSSSFCLLTLIHPVCLSAFLQCSLL